MLKRLNQSKWNDWAMKLAGEQRYQYVNLLFFADNTILEELSRTAQTHDWMPLRTMTSSKQFLEKMKDEEFKKWRNGLLRLEF